MQSIGFRFNEETKEVELVESEKKSAPSYPRVRQPIAELPSDFIAIDFETANQERCSPCSIGVAIVKDNKIIDSFERLIKPHKEYRYFDEFNIDIHGITPKMVARSPEFNSVMEEILPLMEGNVVAAHSMVFDCSVLWHTLELYDMPKPTCKTICSCNIAKIAYPDMLSFSLNSVCSALSINLNHHNAASDAAASAQIIINAGAIAKDVIKEAGYSFGYISEKGHWSPKFIKKCGEDAEIPDELALKASAASGLFNCDFVFTGTLKSMQRKMAHKIVELAGGRASETVNKNTEYLVMGCQDFAQFTDGQKSNKTKKAEALRAKGCPIEIISEEDFLRMIDF